MNLLVTGAFNWTNERRSALEDLGWNIVYVEREDAELDFDPNLIDAVVCNWLFVNHNIKLFQSLKLVQLLSAGLDRVPLEYINQNNIKLYNAHGIYSIPMAEFAVGGVLQLYKDSRGFYDKQKGKVWSKNRELLELYDKRICIVGTGNVGCEVAKRFNAFTSNVYGVDLYPHESSYFRKVYAIDLIDEELSRSDVIVLTLPLTDETKNMFDSRRFSLIKKGAVFVNIARGGLINENALLTSLKRNLLGAVVDVFENEPLPDTSLLWDCSNLIITPHNSFVSNKNEKRMWDVIYEHLSKPDI